MQTRSHDDSVIKLLKNELERSRTIGELSLKSWGLTGVVTDVVHKWLESNTRLHTIKLISCRLELGMAQTFAQLPVKHATFKKVKITKPNISLSNFGLLLEFVRNCSKLHTFILKNYEKELLHNLVTPNLFGILAKSSLTTLCLENCPDLNRIFAGLTEVLSKSDTIAVIRLTYANLAYVFAEHAGAFLFKPSLTTLWLIETDIGDSGLALVAHAIAVNPRLTKVKLGLNSFSSAGLAVLWDVMDTNASLRTLKIDVCTGDTASFRRMHAILSTNTTLLAFATKVRGGYNTEDNALLAKLCGFLISALFYNTTLLKFRVDRHQWKDKLRTLAKLMLTNQTLRKLSTRIYDTLSDDMKLLMAATHLNGSLLELPYYYEADWGKHLIQTRNKLLYTRKHATLTELLLANPSTAKRHQKQ